LMLSNMRESITQILSVVEITPGSRPVIPGSPAHKQKMQETRQDPALMGTGTALPRGGNPQEATGSVTPFQKRAQKATFDENDHTTWGRVQRSAPCPCGSGRKFKHCHGSIEEQNNA